jgi:3-deoxy-manno-octulosonate cytidylyltransferase (CMP-KDO synthetase)
MTSPSHPSGSDRVLEAAEQLDIDQEDILVNIQGDEPALEPAMLSVLIKAFTDSRVRVATLVHRISAKEAQDPNVVKAVRTSDNTALYFSRAPVPYSPQKDAEFLGHIGLYAYRLASLRLFNRLCPSDLEKREQLEQLRFLESGVPIQVVETTALSHGVDSPADIRRLEEILREKG